MKLIELFKNRDSWVKGHFAKDKDNNIINSSDPRAVSFCLLGGMLKCYSYVDAVLVTHRIQNHLKIQCITHWNDNVATFEDITSLVKELDI